MAVIENVQIKVDGRERRKEEKKRCMKIKKKEKNEWLKKRGENYEWLAKNSRKLQLGGMPP